ncbi:type II toxin-antitoxin system VapC family toxin [Geodermatophilus sp. SYSU D01176]
MIAFDSSALTKLVVREPETAPLHAWLEARAEAMWSASSLTRVEVVRAVARSRATAVPSARRLLAGMDLVPITPDLLDAAADLGPPSLRSLDALHLATALSLGSALDAFVVYDERLARAATDAGLPVVAPS